MAQMGSFKTVRGSSCLRRITWRPVPMLFVMAWLLAGTPRDSLAQQVAPILLRWRLSPSEVVVVRTTSRMRLAALAGTGRAADSVDSRLVLQSDCPGANPCPNLQLSRRSDAYTVAMDTVPSHKALSGIVVKGSAQVVMDSLWQGAALGRGAAGDSDPVEMLDDLADAIPVVLPTHPVAAGDPWDFNRTASRTLHDVPYATAYTGRATLDSTSLRDGRETAWLSVRGQRVRTQGAEKRFLSEEQFSGTVAWDIAAGHPISSSMVWHGRVMTRAGMAKASLTSSTTVSARKSVSPLF